MIDRAVKILRAGGLVAFPTETVYGLGADARSDSAVGRIFVAKGRPPTNPLIAHVADVASARRYAAEWPPVADVLAEKFWPGPLTLVVRKSASIVAAATAGQKTVGLRVPAHPIALELLQQFGGPIAAPSANRSNRISPTTAEHVREELGDSVDLILDGGQCFEGIESTVLDIFGITPTILRPGGVSRAQIEEAIGPIAVRETHLDAAAVAPSPGMQAVHYSPRTPAFWILAGHEERFDGETVQMLIVNSGISYAKHEIRMSPAPQDYAHELYSTLRNADAMKCERIIIELPPDVPEWTAVRDRIMRAAKRWHDLRA